PAADPAATGRPSGVRPHGPAGRPRRVAGPQPNRCRPGSRRRPRRGAGRTTLVRAGLAGQRFLRRGAGSRVARPDGSRAGLMKTANAILLAEDNPADIPITQRALRDSGLSVDLLVVRDGQEAVDYLLRQGAHAHSDCWRNPDLILLDLNLPRLNGRE